jgi:hypothetical protein
MPLNSTRGAGSAKGFGFTAGGSPFVVATGGTVTTDGDYKIHTFTSPGTFTVTGAGSGPTNNVDYFVVGGGGGGGNNGYPIQRSGGAGGGGGFRLSNFYGLPAPTTSPLANPAGIPVAATAYPITVGAGGAGGQPATNSGAYVGFKGPDSIFSTITSAGGGGGEGHPLIGPGPTPIPGGPIEGGSGGADISPGRGGNTPPVSPPQGNNGGTGFGQPPGTFSAGGGGGAGGVGGNSSGNSGGKGGVGSYVSPSLAGNYGTTGPVASTRYFSGGGGGIGGGAAPDGGGGTGFSGGNATANSGGGAGGENFNNGAAGNGGSGIVVIRYKYK